MKKVIILIIFLVLIAFGLYIYNNKEKSPSLYKNDADTTIVEESTQEKETDSENAAILNMANPASVYCEEDGGTLEIVTLKDQSQLGMCNLDGYSCEEWAYFRKECNPEEDSQAIFKALEDRGLNLSMMKVVINKHLGKYIEGSVVSKGEPMGGGYVFAAKTDDGMKIVADGNGVIVCSYLKDYPDFSSYLIPECIGADGEIIER